VSASDDQTVRVWDAATGESRQALAGHTGEVTSAQFGPEPSPED
jgi:WD40 repeat protein